MGRTNRLWAVLSLVVALVPVDVGRAAAQETTRITLTDQVLVEDCTPLGIMLGGDNYYSGSVLTKVRTTWNFEGTSYRQCPWGPAMVENGLVSWFGASPEWLKIYEGAEATVLSGPAAGLRARFAGIEPIPYRDGRSERELQLWKIDKRVPAHDGMSALLVESLRLADGQFRPLDGHWTSEENRLAYGDVPPGVFGTACLNLDGSGKRAHLRLATCYQRYMDTNGTWHAEFWAKINSGEPKLQVACDRGWGETVEVPLSPGWRHYDVTLSAEGVPEPSGPTDNPHLTLVLSVSGGELLVDDVEIWKEGDSNPTAFRDDLVAVLKEYGPGGPVRYLQMGGNTLTNTLMPPLKAHSFDSTVSARLGPYNGHRETPYGLHQLYELCEHVGLEPWYCLPGTLDQDEVRQFMEYLAAPADVGFGKLRAELGHSQPWTEVFRRIHVEFGNEAWNNATPYKIGGYNGPDYWRGLIAAGKASPYYRPNVVFHAAGQAASSSMSDRIMADTPNADRYGVAPYIIQSLSPEEVALLDDDEKLFRWVFAWPLYRARSEEGAMYQNAANSRKHSIELSVYEINHHITHGEGALQERNRIVTSLGGGINVANTMLVNLKEHGARSQVLFSLAQHSYNAQGIGPVRLWGTVLNIRAGHQRYRPTFLACQLANRVIAGNLVATEHSEDEPVFEATGIFNRQQGVATTGPWPAILSYGFADGARRGLVLVNLDVEKDRPVSIRFDGRPRGGKATGYLLWSENVADNNEFESPAAKVRLVEREIPDFASGVQISLPRHSMTGLVWEVGE